MSLTRTSLITAALAACLGLTACPSGEKTPQAEGARPPLAKETPASGAPATTVTAEEIQKAADEAAKKIDASNADAELEKLESELGDGK